MPLKSIVPIEKWHTAGCYSAIHATYPSDRHHADRISVGLGAKGAPFES